LEINEIAFTKPRITTISGSTAGYADDKIALNAKYTRPYGMLMDYKRNRFLVTDALNSVIRSIDAQGVTTFIGSKRIDAYLNYTYGIVHFLKEDVFFLADYYNHRILKITPDGKASQYPVTIDRGGDAFCRYPVGLAIDQRNGYLYVANRDWHVIQQITPGGRITILAGQVGVRGSMDGTRLESTFNLPWGLCFSEHLNSLFISDYGNSKIRKFDLMSGVLSTVAGGLVDGFKDGEGEKALFNRPAGITLVDGGFLLVADRDNHRIRRIRPNGEKYIVDTLVGSGIEGREDGELLSCKLSSPYNVYVDNQTMTCYMTEEHAVRKFSLLQ